MGLSLRFQGEEENNGEGANQTARVHGDEGGSALMRQQPGSVCVRMGRIAGRHGALIAASRPRVAPARSIAETERPASENRGGTRGQRASRLLRETNRGTAGSR